MSSFESQGSKKKQKNNIRYVKPQAWEPDIEVKLVTRLH